MYCDLYYLSHTLPSSPHITSPSFEHGAWVDSLGQGGQSIPSHCSTFVCVHEAIGYPMWLK